MKIWLLAHGPVGQEILQFISENYYNDLGAVIVTEDNEISSQAKEIGVTVWNFDFFMKNIFSTHNTKIDLGILAWWPKKIEKRLIDATEHGFLNLHPSFLPYNRGKNYNFWALVEECPFGVSIHTVTPELDCGDIIAQKRIPYTWLDTGETLFYKAQKTMIKLFKSEYPKIRQLKWNKIPQDLSKGSSHKSSELDKASEILLNKQYRARDLLNLIRARTFSGHPACWFKNNGDTYEIKIKITRKKL